jgi:hypothetical protein
VAVDRIANWQPRLRSRPGGQTRLGGIKLYYDFNWQEVFPNGRAQFRGGQSLARLVAQDCPDGLAPALLLTTRDDVEEDAFTTDSEYVVIVDVRRYLAQPKADTAATYYARSLGSGLTSLKHLYEVASNPDVISAVVDRELADWVVGNEDRIAQLRRIAGTADASAPGMDLADVVAALRGMSSLDPEVVEALEGLFAADVDRDIAVRFLRAVTAARTGRYVASEVLGQRIGDRLEDARVVAANYSELLANPGSTETDLQRFIEQNPWLLGLEYVGVRPRRALPRGQLDFILERYDGFHDLLELKTPQDQIILAPDAVDDVPPPAHNFALSPTLAQALAQVQVYRDVLSTDEATVAKRYGLKNTRDPRVYIVIGQSGSLPPHRAVVLRDLNLTLHRMEILPYDVLAQRAETMLDNVALHLSASKSEE